MPTAPPRQVCPLCATDEDVTIGSEGPDMWLFRCAGRRHHPTDDDYVWRPAIATTDNTPGRTGLGEELGVYDDLLACVETGEMVEYGIVEHRFARRSPIAYRRLVDRYGHRSLGPTKYSASTFLAHALGQLQREGLLELSFTPGTGYWDYLPTVSAWARPESTDVRLTTWSAFATIHGLPVDERWPATQGL